MLIVLQLAILPEVVVIIAKSLAILQADKFLNCDWLRSVVFKPNLKYLNVKVTPVS